jgi:hypothetical protein
LPGILEGRKKGREGGKKEGRKGLPPSLCVLGHAVLVSHLWLVGLSSPWLSGNTPSCGPDSPKPLQGESSKGGQQEGSGLVLGARVTLILFLIYRAVFSTKSSNTKRSCQIREAEGTRNHT